MSVSTVTNLEMVQSFLSNVPLQSKPYSSVLELKDALNKAWKELDEKSLKRFLDSLKNRVKELIIKKGDKIYYKLHCLKLINYNL